MNPEPTEPKSPSAGAGLETPGQECPPNKGTWKTGRTIADGYLLVDMGSNQGGDIPSPTEHVGTRAGTAATPANSSNTIFRKASRKPRDKTTSEKNKQFDPGVKGEKPPLWNAAVIDIVFFLSWGELWAMEGSLFLLRVLCLCVPVYLFFIHCFIRRSLFSELKNNMRGDADQVADVRNRRASIFLPINPLKIITTVSGSMYRMPWEWDGFDLIQFSCDALFPRSYFMLISSTVHQIQYNEVESSRFSFCDTVIQ